MIEKIKALLTILDLPSGVVLGIHTLVMIGLSISAFISKRPIDGSIIAVYGVVLGAFAVHKTTTQTTSIITNATASQGSDEASKAQ